MLLLFTTHKILSKKKSLAFCVKRKTERNKARNWAELQSGFIWDLAGSKKAFDI